MEHTPPPGTEPEGEERPQGEAAAYKELHRLQMEERRVRYTKAAEVALKGIAEFGVLPPLARAVQAQPTPPLPPPYSQHGPYPGAGWPGSGGLLPPPEPEEVEVWVVWTGTKDSLTIHGTEVEALRAALAVAAPSTVVPVRYGEPVMEAVSAMEAAEARKRRAAEVVAAEAREAARNEMTRAHEQNKQEREQ